MQSFFCRVLAFVFLFNCLAPAPGAWAQQMAIDKEAIHKGIEQGVKNTLANNLDANIEKAVEDMFSAKDVYAQKDAIVRLHQLMDQKYAREQQRKKRDQMLQDQMTHKAVSTYVAPRAYPAKTMEKNEVLQLVAKNEVTLDVLVDYIDPFSPADVNLQSITYASEILGNTVDAILMNLDEATKVQLDVFLPFAQLRTMYRLNKLSPKALVSLQTIMAVGSLRIAMWKMHNYYVKTQQQDPLMIPQSNKIATDKVTFSRKHDNQLTMTAQRIASPSVALPPEIYQQMNGTFLSELSALKAKNPQEGDGEYQMLMTLADYATTYALLVKPQQLVKIVKLFDKGPERSKLTGKVQSGKFMQQYSAVLNSIFTTTFENTKYMTDSDVWPQVIEMLKDFSDPEKYSLPTRIFALEAASLLYGANTCTPDSATAPKYNVIVRCNAPDPNAEKYRTLFAQRTVDLYAPLTRTHYLAMEDYGLDSEQMKALADKLAYIYNGFANDDLKWDARRELASGMTTLSPVDKEGKPLVLNAKGSIPRLLPINQGHMFQLDNGQVIISSGFGRDSKGNWIEMQLNNKLNARKVDIEYGGQFASFVGNAIFWVYGGQIFSWLGTAFRTTKGAIAALPKARKAAKLARAGRSQMAFNAEIQKGILYANLAKNLSKNGVTLIAQRVVPTAKAAGQTAEAAPKVASQVVTGNRMLQGKYSRWNPKRWLGIKPPTIDGFYFQQATPGFKTVQGFVDVSNSPLKNGIHSWDDWRKLRASFQSVQNPAEHAYPQFFDYVTRKAVFQEMLLTNAMNQAAKNGAFDVWVPIKTPSFQTMSNKVLAPGSSRAPVKAGESFMTETETVTWWNSTRFGTPGNPLAWEKLPEVYITPKTTQNLVDPAQLQNAIKMPLSKVTSNEWQPELINHFFKTVDRQGISRYLLPKYVPNKNFWAEAGTNWRFGMPMGKALMSNTRFWRGWPVRGINGGGFLANMIFFSAWAGLDMGVYPLQKSWLEKTATDEQLAEQKQFGDTFDPEKLKQDELEMQALSGGKANVTGTPQMSTFDGVKSTMRETSEGALITFPILLARHYLPEGLGHMSFVSDQDKLLYQQADYRVQLNRAQLKQNKVAQEQAEQYQQQAAQQQAAYDAMVEEFRAHTRDAWTTSIQQTRDYYLEAFSVPQWEAYLPEVKRFFQEYLNAIMAVFSTKEDPQVQDQKAMGVYQEYNQKWTQFVIELSRMSELLNENAVQEEEYNFDVPEAQDLFPEDQQVPEDNTQSSFAPVPQEPAADDSTVAPQTDPAAAESIPAVPAEAY